MANINIDYKLIGKRIAVKRLMLDITQEELAERAGLTANFISKVENNYSKASIDTIMAICKALDVTPNYLLCGTEIIANQNAMDDVIDKLKLCNTEQLQQISGFINVMVDK